MRRTILTACAVAVAASGAVVGVSVANPPPTVPLPGQVTTVTSTVPAPTRWTEDSLPPVLYLWADRYGGDLVGPRRADRWANAVYPRDRQHRGCYAVVAPTTLIMCPGGLVAYS